MGLNMDWIKPINQQWEIYAESKEQLDTFEIKVTKTQYGTFYQVLRNGQVDDELSSAYQMAAIKSDIKTLLHLGGEFVLVNDIYRLVNGKDWLSGEEENRAEAAGWLTLSALPVSKLAQIAKELKAGNRALKGVALSEKDLEALSKAGVFKDTSGVGKKAKKASGGNIKSDDIKFGSSVKSTKKVNNQMKKRGWSEESVKSVVDHPHTTRKSVNKATGNDATVFYDKDGSYVIIDDKTKEIVQISDKFDKNWVPDAGIVDPYKPKGGK
ncbi:hypothetical protein HB937_06570 [Listeria welshimeri]|nr:hypothetical protein [Listeria welshimeri]